jgi:ABC-type uncharacterized transport system auxiliary subunit
MNARWLPALAMAAMLASSCVGFHSEQAPVQVYSLEPRFEAAAASPPSSEAVASARDAALPVRDAGAAATLQVLRPLAAPGLGTTGIALARDGQRLDYYAASRWPSPLPELMQSLAVDALRATGKFRSVQPAGSALGADHVLQLEVRRCQAVYRGDGPPVVEVQLLATFGRRGETGTLSTASAASSAQAAENRMQSVVAAFQSAVGAALTELAARVGP